MNILYISNHLNTGGITSYLFTLAVGMKKKGHRVTIASSGGEWLSRFVNEGIGWIPIPIKTKNEINPKILMSLLRLSKVLKKNQIEIIHSNSRTTQVLGHLLRRGTGAIHIHTCHGFFKKRFFRKVFPCWPDATIAISASVKEHLIEDFGADEKKIFVVHNGIDTEKIKIQNPKSKTELKKQLGLKEGPVVGIVARLSDVKGHVYLIQAMPQVLKSMPLAQLLIVGDGKMRGELEKTVKNLGIDKSIFFLPSVQDTREVLSVMDLFVMPSLKEGLGLALMEAMAFGLPVIGSDIGGIRSLIKDGINGLLVKPADRQGLANGILQLLGSPEQAKLLGVSARSFINDNFSQEKMAAQTEAVYLKCSSAR